MSIDVSLIDSQQELLTFFPLLMFLTDNNMAGQ